MLTFELYCTLIVSFFLLIQQSHQWVYPDQVDKYFYNRPMVLPSYERGYHAIAIEYNTVLEKNKRVPQFALIYVALVDYQFTFGGHNINTPASFFPNNNKRCAMLLNENREDLCDDDYFLLHSDTLYLEKTAFEKEHSLDTICVESVKKRKPGIKYEDKNKFVMKYGNRVLMMYMKNQHTEKCIGTYDIEQDSFRCVIKDENTKSFKNIKIDGFLNDPKTGEWHRIRGSLEVFCRVPHNFKD